MLRGGGDDGSVLGCGVLVKFSLKPNPSSSKCTFSFFFCIYYLPEEVKRNVQKFHVLTEKESIEKENKLFTEGKRRNASLFTLRSATFHIPGGRLAVSLHLCFLAVLLHLLLQLFLLLRGAVLLLTRLPASLPVFEKRRKKNQKPVQSHHESVC